MNLPLQIGSLELNLAKAALLGVLAASAVLAVNRTAAVYHDGLRTSIPEMWRIARSSRSLATYSYSISIGFIVAYALPYSLATGIIVIHILLLSADIIGLRLERRWVSVAAGFAFGVLVTLVIDIFVFGVQRIAGFGPSLEQLFTPLAYTFPLLVSVTIAHQYGLRPAVLSAALTVAIWKAADVLLQGGDLAAPLTSTGGAIALAVATVGMVLNTLRTSTPAAVDPAMYDEGVRRIQANWPYLIVPPVLIAAAASQGWLAGEPLQVVMLAVGSPEAAAAVAVFSAVGFLPLIALSGIMSGVWNQDGYPDWYLGAGYLLGQPLLAALAGLVLVVVELVSLRPAARLLNTRQQLHGIGSAVRDALDEVPTLSILAGGVLAAIGLSGPFGASVVVASYAFNEAKGRPVMPLAVPVFAFLAVALLRGAARTVGLT